MLNDTPSGVSCLLPRLLKPSASRGTPALPQDSLPCVAAVWFDVCGVLYDDTAWRRWLLQLLSRMGLHTHYVSFYRVWDCEYRDDVAWGRLAYWDAMRSHN